MIISYMENEMINAMSFLHGTMHDIAIMQILFFGYHLWLVQGTNYIWQQYLS